MDARPGLLVSLLALAALAGCVARADSPATMDAKAAYDAVTAIAGAKDPDAKFMAIRGAEGTQWVSPKADDPALQDEQGADGLLGDGLAASWVATFLGKEILELRVYADGRDPVTHTRPAPVPMDDTYRPAADAKAGPQE
ncbi:MAG: hypothetical protein LC620_08635, partial [Halobacteriales archaeon]|nr:hypothetical protein [Halobacteriales archaeon]